MVNPLHQWSAGQPVPSASMWRKAQQWKVPQHIFPHLKIYSQKKLNSDRACGKCVSFGWPPEKEIHRNPKFFTSTMTEWNVFQVAMNTLPDHLRCPWQTRAVDLLSGDRTRSTIFSWCFVAVVECWNITKYVALQTCFRGSEQYRQCQTGNCHFQDIVRDKSGPSLCKSLEEILWHTYETWHTDSLTNSRCWQTNRFEAV